MINAKTTTDKSGRTKTEVNIDWPDDVDALIESALVIYQLMQLNEDYPRIAWKAAIHAEETGSRISNALVEVLDEIERERGLLS